MHVHIDPVNYLNLIGSHTVQAYLLSVYEQDLLQSINIFKSYHVEWQFKQSFSVGPLQEAQLAWHCMHSSEYS